MQLTDYIALLGGLALFLYGMQMMSTGMEAAAGNQMKSLLEKLTSNRFLGIIVGAAITAVIQSSSATTVMVVGFVNSGLMTLNQAVWIIMGANIGTTITGQLIALDIGRLAPLLAFIGVAIILFTKKKKVRHIGSILAGLGILFIGMDMMSTSMSPLQNSRAFIGMLTRFKNPLLGIFAGMIFTALIQSSSASVGILQALAKSGIITLSGASYILFGQNIGTCITALIASVGANRNAKRTTVIHISFNVIGTIIFTTLCMSTGLITFMKSTAPGNVPAQIANLHTLFNMTTTLLLIPFGNILADFSKKILPDKEEINDKAQLLYLPSTDAISDEQLGISAIHIANTHKEIMRMLDMASKNVHLAFQSYFHMDRDFYEDIEKSEEYLDFLNYEISKYISKFIVHEQSNNGSTIFNAYYSITGNLERIGDHAMNIGGYVDIIKEKKIFFSKSTLEEICSMQAVCEQMLNDLKHPDEHLSKWNRHIIFLEYQIDEMTKEYRDNMFQRLQNGGCSDEGGILYSEMLTDFERIGDHAMNIAEELTKIKQITH